jgi:hypothetical protein
MKHIGSDNLKQRYVDNVKTYLWGMDKTGSGLRPLVDSGISEIVLVLETLGPSIQQSASS